MPPNAGNFIGIVSGTDYNSAMKSARVVYPTFRVTAVRFAEERNIWSEKFQVEYKVRNWRVYGRPKQVNKYILTIEEDRWGNIVITSNMTKRSVFFQAESDKEVVYYLLKPSERKYLNNGWKVEIKGDEARASIIDEMWQTQNARDQ